MHVFLKTLAVSALLAGGALPVLAQTSSGDLTCGEYMGLDAAAQATAATALQDYAKNPANSATATVADEQLHGLSTVEVQRVIEAHCSGQTANKNIIERFTEIQ